MLRYDFIPEGDWQQLYEEARVKTTTAQHRQSTIPSLIHTHHTKENPCNHSSDLLMITIHFHTVTFASHTTKDKLHSCKHTESAYRWSSQNSSSKTSSPRIADIFENVLFLHRSFYAFRITSQQVYTTQCNVLVFGAGMFVMNLGDRQMCKNARV